MPTMRALVSLALLAALVVAFVVWQFAAGDEPPAPRDLPRPDQGTTAPAPTAPSERSAAPIAPPAEPSPPPTAATADAPAEPVAPALPTSVVVMARDVRSRQPVAAFRWRVRSGNDTWSGDGADGRAELGLPPDRGGELLVEAADYTPFTRNDLVVPPAGSPPLQLDVFLVPAVPVAGITLHVHDQALQPIQHVRVDAFALGAEPRERGWHLGKSLWARRATANDGAYTLPPLPAGDYGIRVCATDADGNLLPLLPYSRTFTLTGDHGFVEDVPLEPGCVLELQLVDAAGQPYDPTRRGTLTLALSTPGGPPVQRKWRTRSGSIDATAIDVLPGIGGAELAEPIAAGIYVLELRVNGEPRAQQQLALRPGERQQVPVQVP
jgi:hypothetical protein